MLRDHPTGRRRDPVRTGAATVGRRSTCRWTCRGGGAPRAAAPVPRRHIRGRPGQGARGLLRLGRAATHRRPVATRPGGAATATAHGRQSSTPTTGSVRSSPRAPASATSAGGCTSPRRRCATRSGTTPPGVRREAKRRGAGHRTSDPERRFAAATVRVERASVALERGRTHAGLGGQRPATVRTHRHRHRGPPSRRDERGGGAAAPPTARPVTRRRRDGSHVAERRRCQPVASEPGSGTMAAAGGTSGSLPPGGVSAAGSCPLAMPLP